MKQIEYLNINFQIRFISILIVRGTIICSHCGAASDLSKVDPCVLIVLRSIDLVAISVTRSLVLTVEVEDKATDQCKYQ